MTRIDRISVSLPLDHAADRAGARPRGRPEEFGRLDRVPTSGASSVRSLVRVHPVESVSLLPVGRPDTAFLAQLIATRDGLPQTRDRRRAEPDEAQAAYAAQTRAMAAVAPRRAASNA